MVTAITPEDRMLYLADRPDRRVEVLTPGYSGQKAVTRHITQAQPRRAISLGSFDWIAKWINLEQVIAVADPRFVVSNADLQDVGSADEDSLRYMRGRVSATRSIGRSTRGERRGRAVWICVLALALKRKLLK